MDRTHGSFRWIMYRYSLFTDTTKPPCAHLKRRRCYQCIKLKVVCCFCYTTESLKIKGHDLLCCECIHPLASQVGKSWKKKYYQYSSEYEYANTSISRKMKFTRWALSAQNHSFWSRQEQQVCVRRCDKVKARAKKHNWPPAPSPQRHQPGLGPAALDRLHREPSTISHNVCLCGCFCIFWSFFTATP